MWGKAVKIEDLSHFFPQSTVSLNFSVHKNHLEGLLKIQVSNP